MLFSSAVALTSRLQSACLPKTLADSKEHSRGGTEAGPFIRKIIHLGVNHKRVLRRFARQPCTWPAVYHHSSPPGLVVCFARLAGNLRGDIRCSGLCKDGSISGRVVVSVIRSFVRPRLCILPAGSEGAGSRECCIYLVAGSWKQDWRGEGNCALSMCNPTH